MSDPIQDLAWFIYFNDVFTDGIGVPRLTGLPSAEETKALTGMMIGGVTVFALPPDLPIYVDEQVMAQPWVILGSGSRSSKMKASPEVLRRLPGSQVISGLAITPAS